VKLYATPGSPYARMARMVVIEKDLANRVEIVFAQTRRADSPYYRINPSGRVPYLVREDGVGLEESALICDYLDQLDGRPMFQLPAGESAWEARRLEAHARSMTDGIAVWEREIGHALMRGALNMPQLMLACGLGMEARNRDLDWRSGHPQLGAWFDAFARRPSFVATAPPAS
jgi:glutathione S-transferase